MEDKCLQQLKVSASQVLAELKVTSVAVQQPHTGPTKALKLTAYSNERDLTLGGTASRKLSKGLDKKVYAPNLSAIRKRSSLQTKLGTCQLKSMTYTKKSNMSRSGSTGSHLIQMCGLFSEGVSCAQKNSTTVEKSQKSQPHMQCRDHIIDNVLGCNNIKDLLDDCHESMIDIQLSKTPITLEEGDVSIVSKATLNNTFKLKYIKSSLRNLLLSSKPRLLLLQIPLETYQESNEGQIGKLTRFKSGNIKLIFGTTQYDLNLGFDSEYIQDVMTIGNYQIQLKGKMISLGSIDVKITAIPDWNDVLI